MFIPQTQVSKYLLGSIPRSPDDGAGSGTGVDAGDKGGGAGDGAADAGGKDGAAGDDGTSGGEGPGSGRTPLRRQLEKNFDEARRADTEDRGDGRGAGGRFAPRAGGHRVGERGEEGGEAGDGADKEAADKAAADAAAAAGGADKTAAPPAGWSKEAKDTWAALPDAVKAAAHKREEDMAKGVEELKGKYKALDDALTPHMEAIRKNNHTPAAAVAQLFNWFQALASNPDVAFPALAKSFNYDLAKPAAKPAADAAKTAADGAGADAAAAAAAADGVAIPPQLQAHIDGLIEKVGALEKQLGGKVSALESTFQQQSEAKTNEVLISWSKDKPHFEDVRGMMAQLIASGAVPMKDGRVDLDGAYDAAIWANPVVREKVVAEQAAKKAADAEAAAKKTREAEQAQANKSRRAAVSVTGGAPGSAVLPGQKPGKGKSVRESLKEAMEEVAR